MKAKPQFEKEAAAFVVVHLVNLDKSFSVSGIFHYFDLLNILLTM